MRHFLSVRRVATGFLLAMAVLGTAQAARLKDLAVISGQRANPLIGYGLVVGLDGTGDSSSQSPLTGQSIMNMLSSLGVSIPEGVNIQSRNVAAVMVTADLPALARPGQSLDITVSSLGNAKSLRGGTLLLTPLRATNGQVYAMAQGAMVVPGAEVQSRLARISVNQQASGRVPSGAVVEQGAPAAELSPVVEFNFHQADFSQIQRAVETISVAMGPEAVSALDARTLAVRVPVDPNARASVMALLLDVDIPLASDAARVVVNARTGSVVMNQAVSLLPFAVTHGNLTVRVQNREQVNLSTQNRRPQASIQRSSGVSVEPGPAGQMVRVDQGTNLEEVVRALNMLGATPQDLLAILQAMKKAGALRAELEVI